MDDRFLIAFQHYGTPEEIEAWLNARNIEATLTRVVTDIPKLEDGWFPDLIECVVSVRVEWDAADEVRHGKALRQHIAEVNPEASDEAEMYGFNPTEYACWSTCAEAVLDMMLGSAFTIRTGPGE